MKTAPEDMKELERLTNKAVQAVEDIGFCYVDFADARASLNLVMAAVEQARDHLDEVQAESDEATS